MQKLILIILVPFFSIFWSPGGDDLDKMLKEAQQLEQQRKYKSAVDMAVKVQELARKEQNDIVFIQALELEINAQRWFGYETFGLALDRIDKALENPFGRTEILLRSIKISGYNQYYNSNSYQLRNNLNDGIINEEPKQWSKHDIWKLIDSEVKSIISVNENQELNKDELKKLTFSKQVDGVQPTNIKDLAILTAIENMKHFDGDFPFKSDNLYAEKSVFVDSFKKQTVEHPTEIVASYYALLLENMQSEGLLADYFNLMRLNDLFKLDDQYNKLEKYENALQKIVKQNTPIQTSVAVKLAEIYNGYASQYKDQEKINEAINWQNKAIQVCEEALKSFPDSDGAKSCKLLIEQVKSPSINVSLEVYLMDGRPVPVRIVYKNTELVTLKLYRTNAEDFIKSQRHRGVLMEKELPLVWEQKIEVPQYNDFFQHDVITMLPKVEKGFYLLRAETDKLSEGDRDNYEFLNVTNMAIVSSPGDDATNYQLLNRVTGENLTQGQAEIVKINYDYRTKQQNITYDLPRKMNEGKLVLPRKTRGNYLQFTKGEDTLIVRFNYNVKYNRTDKERKNVQIITDRSIYRPGHVVHFKAILTNEKEDDYKPVSDEKLQINLIGSNHKQISQRVLSTNEYGSVYGTFPIPENARPGNFRLQTQYGSTFFEVQYYKRPSFEAEYVTGDKLVKPGEEVELDLHVKSFAGSPIQGAVVETTVKIGASFFRYWPGFNNSQVVDYAVDTTNSEGVANLKFKSLPANTMQFYTIISKVTLPDGASNEFNRSYVVVTNPLNINEILWYNKLWYSEIENEKIPVTGINGEKIKEDIILKVKSLDYSGKYFYKMPFSTADRILIEEDVWQDNFPGMAYNNKLEPSTLERKKTVLETRSKDGFFELNDRYKLDEGWYAFEFYAADTLNKTIYIKTFDPDYKKIKIPDPLTVHFDKSEVLPGESINITLSSKFE
ncbi:MAG: hypothetical protein C0599_02495, partial [Salinivirgaceae bacterium]